jgi:hypothetical protein
MKTGNRIHLKMGLVLTEYYSVIPFNFAASVRLLLEFTASACLEIQEVEHAEAVNSNGEIISEGTVLE